MSHLSNVQLLTLRAAIEAELDPEFVGYRNANDKFSMAAWFNRASTTVVWRSAVSRAEIYNNVSGEATTWSWTFYKNQSVAEQNAWTQMFMGDQADFSKANLRAGVTVIFTSASAANATHALAIGKRNASRFEKLYAVGTGTLISPSVMGVEGLLDASHVNDALEAV